MDSGLPATCTREGFHTEVLRECYRCAQEAGKKGDFPGPVENLEWGCEALHLGTLLVQAAKQGGNLLFATVSKYQKTPS